MKQSFLAFGQARKSTKKCECSGHSDLRDIIDCKYCFTINELKKKCASTRNAVTGEPLGQWGTKQQLLQRLLKNGKKSQTAVPVSDGAGKECTLLFVFLCNGDFFSFLALPFLL